MPSRGAGLLIMATVPSSPIGLTPPLDNGTVFDPINDNCGFYSPPHQNDNNCYAYATDVATNTFPQPGRGSGDKWHDNTCEEMRAASERDGLVWFGNDLPSVDEKPDSGHYVALYIWPGTNFHWARRDSNGAFLLLAPSYMCTHLSLYRPVEPQARRHAGAGPRVRYRPPPPPNVVHTHSLLQQQQHPDHRCLQGGFEPLERILRLFHRHALRRVQRSTLHRLRRCQIRDSTI